MTTPESVLHHLLEDGHLSARDIVRGEVAVFESSARNISFTVRRTTGPGFVYKLVGTTGARERRFEPDFYRLVQSDARFTALRRWTPTLVTTNVDTGLLVLELVGASRDARGAALGASSDPSAADLAPSAASLGAALAACHAIARDEPTEPTPPLARLTPWAFRTIHPGPDDIADMSQVQRETLRLLHADHRIADGAWERRRSWRFDCFTHGDVRWANILVPESGALVLIDWEHAGIGDPAWDLACAWQGWLAHGIETLALSTDTAPPDASAQFAAALPPLLEQICRCTDAYRAALDDKPHADEIVTRAAGLLPLRILQSAMEWARDRAETTPFIVLSSQLAANLLRRHPLDTQRFLGLAKA